MIRALLAYLPLGLWAAAVLTLGTIDFGTPAVPSGADKVAHFVLYGLGGGLAAWAGRKQHHAASAWIGLALVVATGAVDEWRQASLATRSSDIMDWLADAAGAILVFVVVDRLLKKE